MDRYKVVDENGVLIGNFNAANPEDAAEIIWLIEEAVKEKFCKVTKGEGV